MNARSQSPSRFPGYAIGAFALFIVSIVLWFHGHRPLPESSEAVGLPQAAAPGPGGSPSAGLPARPVLSAAPPEKLPDNPVREIDEAVEASRSATALLERARAGARSQDMAEFSEAFRALLDAGEAGRRMAEGLLPVLEGLFADGSDQDRWGLVRDLAGMEGAPAADSLRRLFDQAVSAHGEAVFMNALAQSSGQAANALLWRVADAEEGGRLRSEALQTLAIRGENRDRVIQRLGRQDLSAVDRTAILEGLVQGTEGSPGARQVVWTAYEADPILQETLLQALLRYRDPRAVGITMERLRAGSLSEPLASQLPYLDTKLIREHAEVLRNITLNAAVSVPVRISTFQALYRVDRGGATQGVLTGFPALQEEERLRVVRGVLATVDGDRESRAALERFTAADPSPRIRAVAALP